MLGVHVGWGGSHPGWGCRGMRGRGSRLRQKGAGLLGAGLPGQLQSHAWVTWSGTRELHLPDTRAVPRLGGEGA